MKKDHIFVASQWKKIADSWQLLTPPWRPGKENLCDYENKIRSTIKKIKNPKILLLGATPEIRDMFAKFINAEITLVDYNMEMIMAMNRIVKKNNFAKENWLKASWLTMPLEKKYFDIIVGDYVISQVAHKDMKILLKKVKSLLKNDGLFITRVAYIAEKNIQSFESITEKYDKMKRTNQMASDLASNLCVSILVKSGNRYVFSLPKVKKIIDKFNKENNKNKLFNILDNIFNPYTKEWFFYNLKDTENLLKNNFLIKKIISEPKGSSLAKNTFIYVLQSKKLI